MGRVFGQGVMLEMKSEGRHFLNPITWGYEIHPLIQVPADKCLVLTRLYGTEIPPDRLAGLAKTVQPQLCAGRALRGPSFTPSG